MNLKELRKHRIVLSDDLNISTVDTIGTIAGGVVLAKILKKNPVLITSGLLVLSIPVHQIMKQDTSLSKRVEKSLSQSKESIVFHVSKLEAFYLFLTLYSLSK